MRKALLLFLLLATAWGAAVAADIVVKGVFQGKNLYVSNPAGPGGAGCIKSVTINGQAYGGDITGSAFEIDLALAGVTVGDAVSVVISHHDGCSPKILNRNVLMPKSTYEVKSIKYNMKTRLLEWTTVNESGPLPYYVEQFRWNKWVTVGEVPGTGSRELNSYEFQPELHSGVVKLRVRQRDFTNQNKVSREVAFRTALPALTATVSKQGDAVTFSGETQYEIFNSMGAKVLNGRGARADIRSLPAGEYFLNFDASTTTFKKR